MPDDFARPARRDRPGHGNGFIYGRYKLPDPATGKTFAYTRVTTFAKAIRDTFALTQWELRMATKGLATRTDLMALAAATPLDDKKTLNKIADDAKEAAAASAGARTGSALHKFGEAVDRGETIAIPAPWDGRYQCLQNKPEAGRDHRPGGHDRAHRDHPGAGTGRDVRPCLPAAR